MRSHAGFRFFNEGRQRNARGMWTYLDSAHFVDDDGEPTQFEIFSIPNGVRIEYELGNLDIGIDAIPFVIYEDIFMERIWDMVEERSDVTLLRNNWHPSRDFPGYRQMTEGIRESRINSENMVDLFYRVGWTFEDTIEANERAGIELEIDLDSFKMTVEFILDGDSLIANLPLSEFTTNTASLPDTLDFMKFFGAGGVDAEGFMLVPSGSGAKIMFNNGRYREDPFMNSVYGMDSLTNIVRPQVTQPTRLPILGIQNDGAAFIAHVTSGSALANVNADVAGRTNSYNHSWFSFTLRSSTTTSVTGIALGAGEMTIVQEEIFPGDLTVRYHFLAGDNPGVGEMAQRYQQFLVETGALTPLDGAGDRSFYMDVVGAIDIRRHIMGVPYTAVEVMTTLEDADRIVGMLNSGGINTIQMQLHGWFNRGINHEVAKRVRPVRSLGSQQEMQDLNARLQQNGGGLHPAVNLQLTNWFSRNFNSTFESARDLSGFDGTMARHASRDSITLWFTPHRTDWHYLVHPGALPFHVDRFLPAYERRTGMDGIALTDLGDFVTESLFRRNAVDRESARLIVEEQIGRISNEVPNLVVFGGNDFTFPYASHIVEAPVQADMQYIIDYEVPFFSMIVHGFIEFAGRPANLREEYNTRRVLLNSMATGASPRYTFTAEPTRNAQFSAHERLYSTQYLNWVNAAVEHYTIFNDVYRYLRGERIVDFEVLAGSRMYIGGQQITVTEFSDGTRIYVNNTTEPFTVTGSGGNFEIPPEWFIVQGGTR